MHQGVIVTHASSTGLLVDVLKRGCALSKDIESQWLLVTVHNVDSLVHTIHGNERQDRTKDLILECTDKHKLEL